MQRGHVFVVNEETLATHLKYMFVGTTAGDKDNNIGLLSDMVRVKKDDLIFFYIEGRGSKRGRFFGVFKALEDTVYHCTGANALQPNLPLKLIYRKRISPHRVYPKGVLEWIALDKLPTYAKELLWSLIYRKMKGGRGNTMLLPWETERLIGLIQSENHGVSLENEHFTFDKETYEIVVGNGTAAHEHGSPTEVILDSIGKTETHLQAFLVQGLKPFSNDFLPEIFGRNIIWIGNEVFAGSGMQKIDILTIEKTDDISYMHRLVEIKLGSAGDASSQLEYYINWAREDIGGHLIGARDFNVKPVLVVLVEEFNSIPQDTVDQLANLRTISTEPEIYELNFQGRKNRVL